MSPARRPAPVVLVVGGLDPTAGAGVAADVRTLECLGVASAVAVTALTVQNGRRVSRVVPVSPALLGEQMEVALSSLPVAAVKCGMLPTAKAVGTVAELLGDAGLLLVVDPVLRSSGGQSLASRGVLAALRSTLLRMADVVTPNLGEASALAGMPIADVDGMTEAARRILALGPRAVVIKGGHLRGAPVDVLAVGRRIELMPSRRIASGDMHGTGCAFASALAAGLVRGGSMRRSVAEAQRHVRSLIMRAQRLPNGALIRRS